MYRPTRFRPITLGLAMLASAAIGGVAVGSLNAQSKPSTYIVVAVRSVTDAEGYKTGVLEKAAAVIAAAGGHFVVRTR